MVGDGLMLVTVECRVDVAKVPCAELEIPAFPVSEGPAPDFGLFEASA